MHNSWFFFQHLIPALSEKIKGLQLTSCFSQQKDELILGFSNQSTSFFIKASFSSGLPGLSFPDVSGRAKKNTIDLFQEAITEKVLRVHLFLNERSFLIETAPNSGFLFRMHGASGNIFLLKDGVVTEAFRKNLKKPLNESLSEFDRKLEFSPEVHTTITSDHKKFYFTFTREIWLWLELQGYEQARPLEQWGLIAEAIQRMAQGQYYLLLHDGKWYFSLLPFGKIISEWRDPIHALNEYVSWWYREEALHKKRLVVSARIKSHLDQTIRYLETSRRRLEALGHDDHFKVAADLIMANLDRIHVGDQEFQATRFDDPSKEVLIRLQPTLTAQKNAEFYYRKAKNRNREIEVLHQNIRNKENFLTEIQQIASAFSTSFDLKSLDALYDRLPAERTTPDQELRLPYHEFIHLGYRIWVGRGAADNDELSFKFGKKKDLWLHARDCPGSHVVIKHIAGKNYPKPVIDYAASLAAGYSKRKGETLCPVSVCELKYVRKKKGDPPGLVRLEREEVVMAVPYRA
ncbi:MAG: DUF814 domain-containing protein [Bacteroidetes bacterium]|nr:DUF814 domain-containing protein [Bacteroidota bacterium]